MEFYHLDSQTMMVNDILYMCLRANVTRDVEFIFIIPLRKYVCRNKDIVVKRKQVLSKEIYIVEKTKVTRIGGKKKGGDTFTYPHTHVHGYLWKCGIITHRKASNGRICATVEI